MNRQNYIMKIAHYTVISLLVWCSLPASAIIVGWHDGMYLQPGDGLQLSRQKEPTFPGAVTMGQTGINLTDGWQSENVTFAQNTFDMVKTLSVNSSVSLDSLMASGDIGVSFFGSQTFHANDLTFVFTKTRNFGTTIFTPADFSKTFKDQVAFYQKTLPGEALDTVIKNAFGTHYVRGYQSAAMASVVYTFHYASAAVKQRLTVTASGDAWDSASFSAFVSSFFGSTNTASSMSYQFWSTDPFLAPPFSPIGNIQNFQQFTNFVTQLEGYVNAMSSANAKRTAYVLDPLQTIPGYLSLLGGYIPAPEDPDDYSDFLQAYTALQVWKQRLDPWIPNGMSWLNAQGRQMLQTKWVDVGNYLSGMSTIASNHFAIGTRLELPSDVVAYLANLSDIKLPYIYVMDSFPYLVFNGVNNVNYHCILGRVDCGCRDLSLASPFNTLSMQYYRTNIGSITNLSYSPASFQSAYLAQYKSGTIHDRLLNLFTNEQWACLTNESNPDLNGFFLVTSLTSKAPNWSLQIMDTSGTNVVDDMGFLETRSGGCGGPCQISSGVSVAVSTPATSPLAVVGRAQPVTIQITNQTHFQTYGTTISFVLSNAFDFGGAGGSQGYATFNPTNRVVSYTVGPLLGGASADINFRFIPLRAGLAVPGSPPVLSLGAGLTNSIAVNPLSFAPITSIPARVEISRGPGGVMLDWWSDTDRLIVERSSVLGSSGWSPLSNGQIIHDNHRFMAPAAAGPQSYFRIHSY